MHMRTAPAGYVAESVLLGIKAETWALEYLARTAADAINLKYPKGYYRPINEDDISFVFTLGGSTGNG